MKRNLGCFLLLLFLLSLIPVSGFAAGPDISYSGWVTFTAEKTIDSSFKSKNSNDIEYDKLVDENPESIDLLIETLQPGDKIDIDIDLNNKYEKAVEWYMRNLVFRSLESYNARYGGYTYILIYTSPSGNTDVIYNSNRVGGEDAPADYEGLKEATSTNLSDYFLLDTIEPGKTGHVKLTVGLDGETLGNDYQEKNRDKDSTEKYDSADLRIQFAVRIPDTKIVRTGDDNNFLPLYIGMIAGGLVLLYLALDSVTDRIYFGKKRAGK